MPSDNNQMCSSGGNPLTALSYLAQADNSVYADRTVLRAPAVSVGIRDQKLSIRTEEIETFSQQRPPEDVFRADKIQPKEQTWSPIESAVLGEVVYVMFGSHENVANIFNAPEATCIASLSCKIMVDLLSHGKPGPESFPALAPYTAEELSPMPHILQAKLDEMHAVLDGPNSDEEGMRLRGVISELFRIFHELSHSSEWIEVERKKPEFHKMNETTLDQEEFIGFEITSEMKLARTQAIQDARTWNDLNRVGEDIGARDRAVIAAMEFTLRELTGGRLVADGNVGTMRSEQALPGDAIQVDKEHDQMEKTWNSLVKRPLVLRAKL